MCGASTHNEGVCAQPLRRMGTHTMGATDEHARDASANAQLSALRNWMMRPMGVSSSLLSMLLSEPLLLEPLLVVILPELLLWFILFVRERCALELEEVRTSTRDHDG